VKKGQREVAECGEAAARTPEAAGEAIRGKDAQQIEQDADPAVGAHRVGFQEVEGRQEVGEDAAVIGFAPVHDRRLAAQDRQGLEPHRRPLVLNVLEKGRVEHDRANGDDRRDGDQHQEQVSGGGFIVLESAVFVR
jgi:hypothetical protein